MDRGYEDAYRQFIEPVVGASGDQLEQRDARPPALEPHDSSSPISEMLARLD
jgi:hypothetical protein